MQLSVADGHLCNMGKMIEEMESKLRNSLDQVPKVEHYAFLILFSYVPFIFLRNLAPDMAGCSYLEKLVDKLLSSITSASE